MACSTCDKTIPTIIGKSEYDIAFEMATIEAKADKKIYVVAETPDGKYYHECLECRIKNNTQNGSTIVAYVI